MTVHFRFSMLTIAAFVWSCVLTQAQTISADSTVLNPLARKIQGYINQNQPDPIYALVNDSFKKEVSPTRMKKETAAIGKAGGRWRSMKLIGIDKGEAHYKATFDKGICDVYLGLDKDGKIKTLFFKSKSLFGR